MLENEIYTGSIRRTDVSNQISIPKFICAELKIHPGDPFEISYTNEGEIILRPYDAYRYTREDIAKADKAIQTLNDEIEFFVFNKNDVIYSWENRTKSTPVNNCKITQAMNGERIDKIALKNAILELYPHGSLSVDQDEELAIVIIDSMGQEADSIIFNHIWKCIKE